MGEKKNRSNQNTDELITRKEFLKRTGFSVFAGLFAIKALTEPVNAATVKDNTTKTGVLGEMNLNDVAVDGSYVKAVSQTNGTISVTREAADTAPVANSAKMITSGGVHNATTALSNRIGTSVGSVNRPVYVDASGNIVQCNIWVE